MTTATPDFKDLAERYLDTVLAITEAARTNGGHLASLSLSLREHDTRLEGLLSEIQSLRLALDVRNAIEARVFEWLSLRWLSLLIGVAFGLGLSGAGEILRVLFVPGLGRP